MNSSRDGAGTPEERGSTDRNRRHERSLRPADDASAETIRLLHQLEVHQIELELQNERLVETRAAAEASLARFTELYDRAPVGYVTLDRRGEITQANLTAGSLLGHDPDRLTGLRLAERIVADDRPAVSALLARVVESGAAGSCEAGIQGSSDPPLVVHLVVSPSAERDEFRVVLTDLSERRAAEREQEALRAELRQAQKLESVGRLAGGVAHDFNNMLGVILGHAELALGEVEPDHPVHASLRRILSAAQRSADLTRQLLTFARKQVIRPRTLDLNETVGDMLPVLEPLVGEHVKLVWRPAEGLWPVLIDPAQVEQILANLAVHGREAMNGSGTLTVVTANRTLTRDDDSHPPELPPGEYVALRVADTGAGMDADAAAHLFEPFYTPKPHREGAGLGLATVYGIARQNDGTVQLDTAPGRGTCFTILLPRAVAPPVRQPQQSEPRGARGTETILLVEDQPALLALCQRVLEDRGYRVLTAPDAERAAAVAAAHEGAIDLLLTDVKLPGIDGTELAERLSGSRPDTRVLFMSGHTAGATGLSGSIDPRLDLLEKPFSISTLERRVREALDR